MRGGWALDFQLGQITRVHSDIDVVTWLRHRGRIRRLLEPRGFVAEPVPWPETQLLLVRRDVELNFALVERNQSGEIVSRGFEQWPWPRGTLAERIHELHGIRCCSMSVDALLAEKQSGYYQRRRSRPQDMESIRLLRQLVGEAHANQQTDRDTEEPDELKGSRPLRRGAVAKVPNKHR